MTETSTLASDLETLRGTSIAAIVRATIEKEIISGLRHGGDHVTEQELTERFGVSRGPVREALRALEGQGLLEQKKNRGWFVKLLQRQEIEEIFEMRTILDNGLAHLQVKKYSSPNWINGCRLLSNLVSEMDKAIALDDTGSYAQLNQEFHDALLSMVGNDHLTNTYRNMMGQLASHVVNSLTLKNAMILSNENHKDMINAITSHDEQRLCNIFSTHRMTTLERMSRILENSSQRG